MRGGIYVVPEQVQPKTIERFGGGGLREAEAHARASLRSVRLDDERGQGAEPWFAREKHAREVIFGGEPAASRKKVKPRNAHDCRAPIARGFPARRRRRCKYFTG